jgi:hypothetical protein
MILALSRMARLAMILRYSSNKSLSISEAFFSLKVPRFLKAKRGPLGKLPCKESCTG